MTFAEAVRRSRARRRGAGTLPTVRRKEWASLDLDWTLSVHVLNGNIFWSHRTPFSPWSPDWEDIVATDWEPAP